LALVGLDDDVNGGQLDIVGTRRPGFVVLLVLRTLDSNLGLGAAGVSSDIGLRLVARSFLLQYFLQTLPRTQRFFVDALPVGNFRSWILETDNKNNPVNLQLITMAPTDCDITRKTRLSGKENGIEKNTGNLNLIPYVKKGLGFEKPKTAC